MKRKDLNFFTRKLIRRQISKSLSGLSEENLKIALDQYIPLAINNIENTTMLRKILSNIQHISKREVQINGVCKRIKSGISKKNSPE